MSWLPEEDFAKWNSEAAQQWRRPQLSSMLHVMPDYITYFLFKINFRVLCLDCQRHALYKTQVCLCFTFLVYQQLLRRPNYKVQWLLLLRPTSCLTHWTWSCWLFCSLVLASKCCLNSNAKEEASANPAFSSYYSKRVKKRWFGNISLFFVSTERCLWSTALCLPTRSSSSPSPRRPRRERARAGEHLEINQKLNFLTWVMGRQVNELQSINLD